MVALLLLALASLSVGILLATIYSKFLARNDTEGQKQNDFPPGPPGVPILGNMFDIPLERPWLTFGKWKAVYGNILGLRVLGKSIIILNSYETAIELLNKRSSIYSDRPNITLLWDVAGWNWSLNLMRYGECFHTHRRCLNAYLNPTAVRSYHDMLTREAHIFAKRLSQTPEDFFKHIRRAKLTSTSVHTKGEKFVNLAEEAFLSVNTIPALGLHPLDLWPRLKYLPLRIWGSKLVKDNHHRVGLGREMRNDVFDLAVKQQGTTTEFRSIASSVGDVNRSDERTFEVDDVEGGVRLSHEHVVQSTAANNFFAASDPSVSNVDTFILAMITHPAVQKKAREEIDRLLQGERLPCFEDRKELGYLEAVMKEVLRWRPPAPLGAAPHHLTENDWYNGYLLPKGSIVIFNAWQFLHNEADYPDPEEFIPERFLNENGSENTDVLDPWKVSFGFGRRVCPGRHLVSASTFIAYATLLSLFEFKKAIDEESGEVVEPDMEFMPGFVSHPRKFRCRIVRRDEGEGRMVLLEGCLEAEGVGM